MPSTPTGAGQPIRFAHLRREHPDGLRQDSKGLFKVDEIASDSSLEEADRKQRPDGNQPLRKRSASSFTSTPHAPLTVIHELNNSHFPAAAMHDPKTAIHSLKREQTAFHLPTKAKTGKLNPPAIVIEDPFNDITT